MTIKKAFQDIVEYLQTNDTCIVADVLPHILSLASAKAGGGKCSAHHRDDEGNVVAIRCFYHGTWMDPRVVEFGKKVSSASGLNSMCKEGSSKWTKQQRDAKKAKEQLLMEVASGELDPSDLAQCLTDIEDARNEVVPFSGTDYETLEELISTLG